MGYLSKSFIALGASLTSAYLCINAFHICLETSGYGLFFAIGLVVCLGVFCVSGARLSLSYYALHSAHSGRLSLIVRLASVAGTAKTRRSLATLFVASALTFPPMGHAWADELPPPTTSTEVEDIDLGIGGSLNKKAHENKETQPDSSSPSDNTSQESRESTPSEPHDTKQPAPPQDTTADMGKKNITSADKQPAPPISSNKPQSTNKLPPNKTQSSANIQALPLNPQMPDKKHVAVSPNNLTSPRDNAPAMREKLLSAQQENLRATQLPHSSSSRANLESKTPPPRSLAQAPFTTFSRILGHRFISPILNTVFPFLDEQYRQLLDGNRDFSSGTNKPFHHGHGTPGNDEKTRTYTVFPGDSLWKICRGVLGEEARNADIVAGIHAIVAENKIPEPNVIYPGQLLKLPMYLIQPKT